MNAIINLYGDNVVGISFNYTHLQELASCLNKSLSLDKPCEIKSNTGVIEIILNDDYPSYALIHDYEINIFLNQKDYLDLIYNIDYHWKNHILFPLDYSLESKGIKIFPLSIKDIVIESKLPEN